MNPECPKLRDLEALPHTERGKPVVVLRDPTQISREMLVVSPELYAILLLFNGQNSVLDIQAALTRRTGNLVYREFVENLIQRLDEIHFLDNENLVKYQKQLEDSFRKDEIRRAFHAGSSYPAEAGELEKTLTSFYRHAEGAGMPGVRKESRLRALAAPHIDPRLGGTVYTHPYRALAESRLPDVFVILGTAHMGLPNLFSICPKDFETPLGVAEIDKELLNSLTSLFEADEFGEDLAHRNEHTIEFQVIFLQHLLAGKSFKILPILAGFSYSDLETVGESGECRTSFQKFVKGLLQAERLAGRRVCFIASVDFAHIGPRYGDSFRPTRVVIEQTLDKDRKMLNSIERGEAVAFLDFIRTEEDRRRICGFAPIFTLLSLLEGRTGETLAHSFSEMDDAGSFVTFAGLAFRDQ